MLAYGITNDYRFPVTDTVHKSHRFGRPTRSYAFYTTISDVKNEVIANGQREQLYPMYGCVVWQNSHPN